MEKPEDKQVTEIHALSTLISIDPKQLKEY